MQHRRPASASPAGASPALCPPGGGGQRARSDDAKRKRIAKDRRKQGNGPRRNSKGYRGQHQCAGQAISSQHQRTDHRLTVARQEQGPRGDQNKREGHAKGADTSLPSAPQPLTMERTNTRPTPNSHAHSLKHRRWHGRKREALLPPHTMNVPGQAWRWLLCRHHRRPASSS